MAEMRERLAVDFKLTPEDLAEKQKGGGGLFANRLAWAVVYLKRAELVTPAGRAVYRITDRGRALLKENPPGITTKTLLVWFHKGGPAPGIDPRPPRNRSGRLPQTNK
jgi:restriction system protein